MQATCVTHVTWPTSRSLLTHLSTPLPLPSHQADQLHLALKVAGQARADDERYSHVKERHRQLQEMMKVINGGPLRVFDEKGAVIDTEKGAQIDEDHMRQQVGLPHWLPRVLNCRCAG